MAMRRVLAIFRNDQDAADATDALQGLGMLCISPQVTGNNYI